MLPSPQAACVSLPTAPAPPPHPPGEAQRGGRSDPTAGHCGPRASGKRGAEGVAAGQRWQRVRRGSGEVDSFFHTHTCQRGHCGPRASGETWGGCKVTVMGRVQARTHTYTYQIGTRCSETLGTDAALIHRHPCRRLSLAGPRWRRRPGCRCVNECVGKGGRAELREDKAGSNWEAGARLCWPPSRPPHPCLPPPPPACV